MTYRRTRLIVSLLGVLLNVLFILGLGATDYRGSAAFVLAGTLVLIGSLSFNLLRGALRSLLSRWRLLQPIKAWALVGLLVSFVLMVYSVRSVSTYGIQPGPPPPMLLASTYEAVIRPEDSSMRAFVVSERITLDPKWRKKYVEADRPPFLSIPDRKVVGQARGWLLREVHYMPPEQDSSGYAIERYPDGTTRREFLLWYALTKGTVSLKSLPVGSFYAAKGAGRVDISSYVDEDQVKWELTDLEDGITFAFVRPSLRYFVPVIRPFVSISSIGPWALALLGGAISGIVVASVKPLVVGGIQDTLTRVMNIGRKKGKKSRRG